ncbi:MAG: ABC transporter permease [Peptococcaceae bacterium]|nr:ABC transporter permease [Peptococcaceae bacterium]
MAFDSAKYVLIQALLSLKRNIWLSIASIMTVMISLTLLGCSVLFLANTSHIAKTFESQVEIAVFLNERLESAQITELQNKIEKLDGVSVVTLTTKDQAILDFQESMGSKSLLEDLGGVNPFPNKFTITAKDARMVETIASQVTGMAGVDKVRFGQGMLEKLIVFTNWLRWIGIGVVAAFSFASILLITLNIKTNVNSREKEIHIMRLVGASNGFIRWPFFLEGLMIGLIGAVMAIIVVGTAYTWLMQYIINTLAFMPVVADQGFIMLVLFIMLLCGMSMGALASAFSVRKFLRV